MSKHSNSTTIAAWEMSSLVYRLSHICSHLRMLVDLCHQQIEGKVHQKLLHLFEDTHSDNQEVLRMLLGLKDDFPLKDGHGQAKDGISKLVNKEVIILVSKPDIPPENFLLLVQQTYDHPHNHKLKGSYDIIWLPISSSSVWTNTEVESFAYLSNSLPWFSIRQPWLLSSSVVDYVKQVWHFIDEPLMIVLDRQGRVTNSNAIDMVLIWGSVAYPFSSSREVELWEETDWTLKLLMDELSPLISMWVEEGRNLCIYGSDEMDWVKEFCSKMKEIINTGVQLDLIYVGCRNPGNVGDILTTITKGKLSGSLSYLNMRFFWLRLEAIKRSRVKTPDADHILEGVESLLDLDYSKNGWAVLGQGSSTDVVKLQGRKVMECLDLFQVWGRNVEKVGFTGAIKSTLEPPLLVDHCGCSTVVPYSEGLIEGIALCKECKRPMVKLIFYQCPVNEEA